MKIQFVISGWYFNQFSLIDGLIELNKENENVDVFYSCHREPPDVIKDNFNWKLFPNRALGDGAYEQAIDYLDIDDDTVCFFMHDDLIIKDWNFIYKSVEMLDTYIVLGNGWNHPTSFNPDELYEYSYTGEITHPMRDFAKSSTKHLFDKKMDIKTIRGSFICLRYKHLKKLDGFEPCNWPEAKKADDGHYYIPGDKGLGGLGNIILVMFSYKINKIFGHEKIGYLSNTYLNSPYIYECARGKIHKEIPIT